MFTIFCSSLEYCYLLWNSGQSQVVQVRFHLGKVAPSSNTRGVYRVYILRLYTLALLPSAFLPAIPPFFIRHSRKLGSFLPFLAGRERPFWIPPTHSHVSGRRESVECSSAVMLTISIYHSQGASSHKNQGSEGCVGVSR
jgi:hypothetical protein